MEHFDWHKWNPDFYKTPEEMDAALDSFGVKGKEIATVHVIGVAENMGKSSAHPETRYNITFQFWLKGDRESGDFGFFVWQRWEGWFKFGVTLQNHFMELGNKTATVPFSLVKSVAGNTRQIMIVEGHDSSSYFWIMPVKPSKEARFGMEEYRKEEISIEEDDVFTFLYYFLNKYFDDTFPYEEIRPDYCGNRFEWNLEYNVYSYETMRIMLQDIEECIDLLEHEFDDPYLVGVKERFKWNYFDPDGDNWNKRPSDLEAETIIRNNIHVATDFYRRFVWRIRAMMESSPDYDLISFMGP